MSHRSVVVSVLVCVLITSSHIAKAAGGDRRIPDEYESVGGHSLGLGNSGVAAVGGLSAVRVNPAMLSVESTYNLFAGYHWPSHGRDFYQLGVVDSKTSQVAAAFMYTGFSQDYGKSNDNQAVVVNDSPVKRRATVALARNFSTIALGLNVQYVESYRFGVVDAEADIKGTSIAIGVVGLLTPQLRFGISAENLANSKVKDVAPQTYRTGLAYHFAQSKVTAHIDYRYRKRVAGIEDYTDVVFSLNGQESETDNGGYDKAEQMLIGSFSAQVYDIIRLLGGYGHSIAGVERRSLSAGVALVQGGNSISYTVSQPYTESASSQQAVNFSYAITF